MAEIAYGLLQLISSYSWEKLGLTSQHPSWSGVALWLVVAKEM